MDYNYIKVIYVYMQNNHVNDHLCNIDVTMCNIGAIFMEIKRNIYLDRLVSKMNNGLIKIITGIRWSGRSHLLFSTFHQYLLEHGTDENHIIEISFDRFEDKKYRDPELAYSYIKSCMRGDETYFILLDEVQLLKDFNSVLNGLIRIQNVDLYLTGNDSDFLASAIAESGGRADELRVYPLSFSEFMSAYDGNRYDGWNEYILYGGLPSVSLIKNKEQKISFLKQLFEDSFLNDITRRHKLRNREELDELLKLLSSSIGSLTNPKQLSDTFRSSRDIRISQTTLKNYIDYLCEASLVTIAQRYDIRGRKYISTPVKYYFADIGLRNACLGFREIGENRVMENVIYNELLIRGFQVDAGVASFSLKNEEGQVVRRQLEVDFMCSRETTRYYIQAAYALPDEDRMRQIQEPFRRIDDFFKRIIITRDCPAPYYTENGILVMSIYDFLLDQGSLNY